ncbi:DM13 domain-containing protein [Neoaquamicrobium sediminum]|uniref:DM13 domain-containing protein n=1 Tax=Neoaquamicrobium sediminum TaxID=1849104 RepID=UPI0019D609FD|nr:DM13 domain-containing protein [Mesorhizobium sediminum]
MQASNDSRLVAKGTFIHANPSDPIHYGSGGVSLYSDTVFLNEDFEVGPGPKYHVYLVPRASIRSSADVEDTMFVDLGQLRAFQGSQNYTIPAGVDLNLYQSVVIWCEHFSVLISPADLDFET